MPVNPFQIRYIFFIHLVVNDNHPNKSQEIFFLLVGGRGTGFAYVLKGRGLAFVYGNAYEGGGG